MPFAGTGPATYHVTGTTDAQVFAGHWLYFAGTTTTAAMTSSMATVTVSNPSLVTAGQYVVIYDAPAGSFKNAEHALVTNVDATTKLVTLQRGYRSNMYAHAAGAVMANHVLGSGAGTEARVWAYNQTTVCPRDANGKTLGEFMADWLAININRDPNGKLVDVVVDGILLDADKYEFSGSGDANNDLVNDDAIINGVNTWGEGLKSLHAALRSKFPGKIIVGGVARTRSYEYLSGSQMEEWPTVFKGTLESNFDSALADYAVNMHYRQSSIGTHALVRLPSHTYPDIGITPPADNKSFRFSFASSMLDDGYYGKENSVDYPDVWYDEFAVDVVPGSPYFGNAIAANDPNIRFYRGWMGRPMGSWKRLYNDVEFAPTKSLVSNGTFDAALTGWKGTNVIVSADNTTGNIFEGTAAMKASAIKAKGRVDGPSLTLLGNTEYTLAFAVKAASTVRTIRAGLGNTTQQFFIPTKWVRRVMKIKTGAAGTYKVNFQVGEDAVTLGDVWIDSVYLFQGNPNVFTREFDKALVIVNATSVNKTVSLGKTYKRIKGAQDPINDGSTLSSVTVGAWDAAILIKP